MVLGDKGVMTSIVHAATQPGNVQTHQAQNEIPQVLMFFWNRVMNFVGAFEDYWNCPQKPRFAKFVSNCPRT